MKSVCDSPLTGTQSDTPLLDLCIKTENVEIKIESDDCEMLDRPEYIEIKSETNHRQR